MHLHEDVGKTGGYILEELLVKIQNTTPSFSSEKRARVRKIHYVNILE